MEDVKGSWPRMEMVEGGESLRPERRRRRVVLPEPLAPRRRVRERGGRERVRVLRRGVGDVGGW